jgi:hypothetical protein
VFPPVTFIEKYRDRMVRMQGERPDGVPGACPGKLDFFGCEVLVIREKERIREQLGTADISSCFVKHSKRVFVQ